MCSSATRLSPSRRTIRRRAHGSGRRPRKGARPAGARSLLGCDGANSFVRKRLDIPLEDLGFDEWWMVVDTRIRRPVDLPPRSYSVLLAVAAVDLRPRAGQSAPLGDQAAAGRATRGIRPVRQRRPTDLPLRRSILLRDLALGRLSLSCAAGRTVAAWPRLSPGRCVPSDSALSGPRHVRRHSRRGKPRLEAGDGLAGGRARCAARHLRAGAQTARPHAGGDRQGIRFDHRRARSRSGAIRDETLRGQLERGEARNDPPALCAESRRSGSSTATPERAAPAPCSCNRRSSAPPARTRWTTRSCSTICSRFRFLIAATTHGGASVADARIARTVEPPRRRTNCHRTAGTDAAGRTASPATRCSIWRRPTACSPHGRRSTAAPLSWFAPIVTYSERRTMRCS